ncbi:ARI5A protein, partial [Smithornis capensis]|nr:ARI5A protein [Smithornis capensis]
MSPLAKKKLLAQVSEAESLCCHQGRCHPGGTRWAPGEPGPAPRSPEPSGAQEAAPSAGNEAGCSGMEPAPVPTVFTGYFHAYGSEGLQAPLWGCFSNLKDFLEPPPAFPEPEQPWESRGAAVHAWVPPGPGGAARAGHGREEEEEEEEEEEDEEPFGPSAKLRAVSPFPRDAEGHRDTGGHQGLPKPKAVVASPGFAALHFPAGFGNPLEHLKTQGVPVAPGLSANPFVIPAFPSPLVVGSSELCRPLPGGHFPPSYGNSLRHRLYPWHGHHSCGSPAFHRHAKL